MPVTASVGGSCTFGSTVPTASYTFNDFDLGFTQDTAFVLNCNGASNVAVVSANGGLLTGGSAPSGYTTIAPYTVALHLAGDGGLTADSSCLASTLTASAGAPCAFRGPASLSQGLKLNGPATNTSSYVRVSAPAYSAPSQLIASTSYADTLTVTLSAAI